MPLDGANLCNLAVIKPLVDGHQDSRASGQEVREKTEKVREDSYLRCPLYWSQSHGSAIKSTQAPREIKFVHNSVG